MYIQISQNYSYHVFRNGDVSLRDAFGAEAFFAGDDANELRAQIKALDEHDELAREKIANMIFDELFS